MACFFCQRTGEKKCEPSCGLCGITCPGYEGKPNGMKYEDYTDCD